MGSGLLRRLRILGALFLFWQSNSPVRVFVNFPVLLHFSRELYQGAAARMTQAERGRNFAQALRLAGPCEVRYDLGFRDSCARLIGAWHGNGHCMRTSGKTRRGWLVRSLSPFVNFVEKLENEDNPVAFALTNRVNPVYPY